MKPNYINIEAESFTTGDKSSRGAAAYECPYKGELVIPLSHAFTRETTSREACDHRVVAHRAEYSICAACPASEKTPANQNSCCKYNTKPAIDRLHFYISIHPGGLRNESNGQSR
jgi:hypothetical protein